MYLLCSGHFLFSISLWLNVIIILIEHFIVIQVHILLVVYIFASKTVSINYHLQLVGSFQIVLLLNASKHSVFVCWAFQSPNTYQLVASSELCQSYFNFKLLFNYDNFFNKRLIRAIGAKQEIKKCVYEQFTPIFWDDQIIWGEKFVWRIDDKDFLQLLFGAESKWGWSYFWFVLMILMAKDDLYEEKTIIISR